MQFVDSRISINDGGVAFNAVAAFPALATDTATVPCSRLWATKPRVVHAIERAAATRTIAIIWSRYQASTDVQSAENTVINPCVLV